MRYIVSISDSGPLSIRAGRETTGASTLKYIPGSLLLGMLASTHADLKDDTAQFNEFFFKESSSFGNLYPSSFKHDNLAGNTDPVYPLPATALSCKRFSGFVFDQDDKDDPSHGVFDSLIPWGLFNLSGQSRPDVLDTFKSCPACQEPLDRYEGFYRRSAFGPQAIGTAEVNVGLRTRTGINRATGTAQYGILYSREVLRPPMTFWGVTSVPDKQAEAFYGFAQEANSSGLLRLGSNRTRGFGRVILELQEAKDSDSISSLREWIQTFDTELRRQAQDAHIATPHKLYMPMTLISDAILFDRLLRYRAAIEPDYLQTLGIAGADLIYQKSSTRKLIGWNGLWGLPKPNDIAITMGSVFLFGLSTLPNDDLLQALLRLQTEGIGARRREGFGRLLIASPFHWEVKGQ